jgi:hypothetical protein
MAAYSASTIKELLVVCTDATRTTTERGRAFEGLFCYLLDQVPGLRTRRNTLNPYRSEEIDIAVANTRISNGLACFPHLFLVECKNWSAPVNSPTIGDFIDKLTNRCVELGVLVVANRVTGDPADLSAAYHKATMAQSRGHRLIVISLDDLLKVSTTRDLTDLLVDRLLGVIASGTFQLS